MTQEVLDIAVKISGNENKYFTDLQAQLRRVQTQINQAFGGTQSTRLAQNFQQMEGSTQHLTTNVNQFGRVMRTALTGARDVSRELSRELRSITTDMSRIIGMTNRLTNAAARAADRATRVNSINNPQGRLQRFNQQTGFRGTFSPNDVSLFGGGISLPGLGLISAAIYGGWNLVQTLKHFGHVQVGEVKKFFREGTRWVEAFKMGMSNAFETMQNVYTNSRQYTAAVNRMWRGVGAIRVRGNGQPNFTPYTPTQRLNAGSGITFLQESLDRSQALRSRALTQLTAIARVGINIPVRLVYQSTRLFLRSINEIVNYATVAFARISAIALPLLVGGSLKKASDFESLQMSLKTVTGSVEEAAKAFEFVKQLAKDLPFSLEEATTAFIRMTALGITPTRERIVAFSNVAAGMNKDLMQFVEAVADAGQGEFERLKEFGIKAHVQGEQISFVFRGVRTTIGNNAKEITNYLQKLGEVQFAGGATDQMKTMKGQLSNLGDAVDTFLVKFANDTGLFDWAKSAVQWFTKLATSATENMGNIRLAIAGTADGLIRIWISFKNFGLIVFGVVEAGFVNMVNVILNTWDGMIYKMKQGYNAVAGLLPYSSLYDTSKAPTQRPITNLSAKRQELLDNQSAEWELHGKTMAMWYDDINMPKKAGESIDEYNKRLNAKALAEKTDSAATDKKNKSKKDELSVYEQLNKAISDHRKEVIQAGIAQQQLASDFAAGKISAQEYQLATEKVNEILKKPEVENYYTTQKKSIQEHRVEVQQANAAAVQFSRDLASGAITADEYKKAMEGINDVLGKTDDLYTTLHKDFEANRVAEMDAIEAEGRIREEYAAGKITLDQYEMAMEKIFSARGVEYKKPVDGMVEYYKNAARSIQSSLADFLFNPFEQGLKGMVNGVRDSITRIMAELLAAQAIKGLMGNAAETGQLGGLFGMAGNFLKNIAHFAGGGQYSAGVPRMVGEYGPEIDIPSVSGAIIPNHQIGSVLSGMGGNNVSFTIHAMDGQSVMSTLQKNREQITKMVLGTKQAYRMA